METALRTSMPSAVFERMMPRDEIIDAQGLARDWKTTPAGQHDGR
jgi:hypothetical protein